MNRFETECRRLIDGLARELAALADDLAQNEIRAARKTQAKEQTAAQKAQASAKTLKVSARLARALERAEERRRLAAERRVQKLAQRSARRAPAADGPHGGRARSRAASAPAALVPPPLFVHKRSRDGSIKQLERPPGEGEPAAAVPS